MEIDLVFGILVMLLGYHVAFLAFNIGETFLGLSLFIIGLLITTLGFSIIVEELV